METIIFRLFGILGLIAISIGVLLKNEQKQDWVFIIGGLCLLAYSSYLGDWIFIILQIVFIVVAALELIKLRRKKRSPRQLFKRL